MIGAGDLLAVACEGTSPLPRTFPRTINGPRGILNGCALAAALNPNPVGSLRQQLLQQDQTSGRKVGKVSAEYGRLLAETVAPRVMYDVTGRVQTAQHGAPQTTEEPS